MSRFNVLPFAPNRNGMGRRRINKAEETQVDQTDTPTAERDKNPERKSIVLPAYMWRIVENDAEQQLRTVSKQLEAILINHYQLGTHKIESMDKSPGSFGFVQYVNDKKKAKAG